MTDRPAPARGRDGIIKLEVICANDTAGVKKR